MLSRRARSRTLLVAWAVLTLAVLAHTAYSSVRRASWYLAVDQYGYLTFAEDLTHGRVFHEWPPFAALQNRLFNRSVDVLAQTYIWDAKAKRLYCRYSPGYPILLAGWMLAFGRYAVHYFNTAVYVLLLVVMLAFQKRVFRSRWRATAGIAFVVLFPTWIRLWAVTPVRDLPAHLAALFGLYLLLPVRGRPLAPGRAAAAGLPLGFAATIRPDAILYLVPALAIALARWRHERTSGRALAANLAAGGIALGVGLAPFLGYNWAATGNPLRPTQGMEVQQFLEGSAAAEAPARLEVARAPRRVGYPPGAWKSGTVTGVQGGGLRLANLPSTLPGNLELLRTGHTEYFLAIAAWGAVLAFVRRRLLFVAAVPYIVCAVLFFSCWTRPDWRYLVGVYLFLAVFVVEGLCGTFDLMRRLALRGRLDRARVLGLVAAALLVTGAPFATLPSWGSPLPTLLWIVPGVGGAGLVGAAMWPRRRAVAVVAPVLATALVVLAVTRTAMIGLPRARFQRPEAELGRRNFAQLLPPRSVVITSEDVGRPAENLEFYGPAHAIYLTDLARWHIPVERAALFLYQQGWKPYLYMAVGQRERAQLLAELAPTFDVSLVADIPRERALDYFVGAPFHSGLRMHLYRLEPLSTGKE